MKVKIIPMFTTLNASHSQVIHLTKTLLVLMKDKADATFKKLHKNVSLCFTEQCISFSVETSATE